MTSGREGKTVPGGKPDNDKGRKPNHWHREESQTMTKGRESQRVPEEDARR